MSLQQAQMASGLFQGLIPELAKNNPDLEEEICHAADKALQAVKEFSSYLEKELLPNAEGSFAVGEERFNQILIESHMVDYDAEELLAEGWEIFEETKEEMNRVAESIDPQRSIKEILEEAKSDHPAASELISVYKEVMEETKEFVLDKGIVSIPAEEELRIIETPAYLRPTIPYAAYIQPGIFEDKLEGIFFVTPVDPDSPREIQEEKLKGHFNSKLPITVLHEGYPGHHLQLVWSVTHGSIVRKFGMALSTLFIEGWAFYCEELMEELGYINSPLQKLSRLSDQLWRAARIILDVSLHCKGMTVDQAVEFLVEECQLEKSNATAEVIRYTATPTQPQSYLMGKLKIIEIIEEYKKKHPAKSMLEIHDDILASGSLPPKLLKKDLFG